MTIASFVRWLAGAAIASMSTAAGAQQGPLVDAEWLAANLNNPKLRVFEVSVDPGVYERGPEP